MRKKFVYFVLVPLLALSLVLYFFLAGWIESSLESAGEAIVGARVEIDHLSLSLSPIAVQFTHLQVANPRDPWKNIFETGRVRFALNFGQLLRGKYIIETAEVNNLIIGTKRSTNGSIPRPPPLESGESSIFAEATSALVREAQKAPVFDLAKIRKELKFDSLLNVKNLRSVQYIDTLKRRVQQANQQWQSTLADLEKSKQRIAEIQTNIAAINLNDLKTLDKITAAVNNANSAYKGLNDLNETYKFRRGALTDEINRLYASTAKIDDLAKADYETVARLARLPDLSTKGIANLLLGREILHQVNTYLSWIDYARTNIPKYTPAPDFEKPSRFEGQDIEFPVERSYPRWWIKKVLISGGEDKTQNPDYLYARGEVLNVTNNQALTGFPLTVALAASKSGGSSYSIDASFDRRTDSPVDNYKITASDVPAGDVAFGQQDFVPSKISNATLAVAAEATVPGRRFDASARILFQRLTFVFDRDPKNDIERITRSVLGSITGFAVALRLWNTAGSLEIALTTDLDNQLAARTKSVLGDELTRIQNEVRAKVNQTIAEKRAEFEKLFNQKKEEAIARLGSYGGLLGQNLSLLDTKKKDIDARVEQEKKKQTDAVKKKAEDALKGLFKKR
ncbi:MAG TPA: hypothetical protein DEP53_12070 [Bacteroidetes bacterium]|nr:hypothetical protein [Bacteroidota bacterium]